MASSSVAVAAHGMQNCHAVRIKRDLGGTLLSPFPKPGASHGSPQTSVGFQTLDPWSNSSSFKCISEDILSIEHPIVLLEKNLSSNHFLCQATLGALVLNLCQGTLVFYFNRLKGGLLNEVMGWVQPLLTICLCGEALASNYVPTPTI